MINSCIFVLVLVHVVLFIWPGKMHGSLSDLTSYSYKIINCKSNLLPCSDGRQAVLWAGGLLR